MLVSALVFGQSVYGQTSYAPMDVPRDHWAFHAVDDLFKAGLLKGYPASTPPDLEMASVAFDLAWLEKTGKNWKARGLLVGYPVHLTRTYVEPSRYELAVMVHATSVILNRILSSGPSKPEDLKLYSTTGKEIVKAMGMLSKELTELNVDLPEMLAELNRSQKLPYQRFQSPS